MEFTNDSEVLAAGEMNRRDFLKKTAPAVVAPTLSGGSFAQVFQKVMSQPIAKGLTRSPLEAVASIVGLSKSIFNEGLGHYAYEFGRFKELGGRYGLKIVGWHRDNGATSFLVQGKDGKLHTAAVTGTDVGNAQGYHFEGMSPEQLAPALQQWFAKDSLDFLNPDISDKPPTNLRELEKAWDQFLDNEGWMDSTEHSKFETGFEKYTPDTGEVPDSGYSEDFLRRPEGMEDYKWTDEELTKYTPEQRKKMVQQEYDQLEKSRAEDKIRQLNESYEKKKWEDENLQEITDDDLKDEMNELQDERPSYNQTHGPFDWEPGDESKWASILTHQYTNL
jgi:hypothetical protein